MSQLLKIWIHLNILHFSTYIHMHFLFFFYLFTNNSYYFWCDKLSSVTIKCLMASTQASRVSLSSATRSSTGMPDSGLKIREKAVLVEMLSNLQCWKIILLFIFASYFSISSLSSILLKMSVWYPSLTSVISHKGKLPVPEQYHLVKLVSIVEKIK